MPAEKEPNYLQDLWRVILGCPMAVFAAIMTLLMGYTISFVLFDYRANPKGLSHLLHLALGTGYSCLVFVLMNCELIFSGTEPLTLDRLAAGCPRTMVLSFAVLVVVVIGTIIIRERIRTSPRG